MMENGQPSSRRLRILILAPFAPRLQASHGGGRVIAQLITHLALRHSIGLCYLRSEEEPGADRLLVEHCEFIKEVVIPKIQDSGSNQWARRLPVWKALMAGKPLWAIDRHSQEYGKRVQELVQIWQPDIVQIEFHIMGQYLSALADSPAPRILVQHEPGTDSVREAISSGFAQGQIISRLDLLAWQKFERQVFRQVQAAVVFTEQDHQAVCKLGVEIPVVQIPLGTEIPPHSPSASDGKPLSLLFVGNFKHLPNLDAADHLINKIFPPVQSQFTEARLVIVGDHLPTNIVRKADKNVIITGYVHDLKPYMDDAALVVVPLRLGGGMRVKVLEALAAGKAVVASSRAVEGLGLVNGEHFVVAEDDDDFSDAILHLLANPEKRRSLGDRARAWAEANLSWEKVAEQYETLYQNLLKC